MNEREQELGRTGRTELLEIIARLERDNRQLNDNLTATQTRCTELLNENRELRKWAIVE